MLTDEEYRAKQIEKAEIVMQWLDWIERKYDEMLSRQESSSAPAGFDSSPQQRPCEHRREWKRGKLCLACDNTGWRKATTKEKLDGIAYDPYAFEIPKNKISVTTSESSTAAMNAAKLDAILAVLKHHAAVRDGRDVLEDRDLVTFRIAAQKPVGAKYVIAAMLRVQAQWGSGFSNFLDRWELACLLAAVIKRRLNPPRVDSVPS